MAFSDKLEITAAGAKKTCQIIRSEKGWQYIATLPVSNQIYLVTFTSTQLTQASFLQKIKH